MKSILLFCSGIAFCSLLSFKETNENLENSFFKSKPLVDTVAISDSTYHILKYGEYGIESIEMGEKYRKGSLQSIYFHPNGMIKEAQMVTGVRLDEKMNEYQYQLNILKLSENGTLIKCYFMNDFKYLLKYPE